jgi:hypothetical protein
MSMTNALFLPVRIFPFSKKVAENNENVTPIRYSYAKKASKSEAFFIENLVFSGVARGRFELPTSGL